MRKNLYLALAVIFCLCLDNNLLAAPMPDIEPGAEHIMSGKAGENELLDHAGEVSFFRIGVDASGIGHLQSRYTVGRRVLPGIISPDWNFRLNTKMPVNYNQPGFLPEVLVESQADRWWPVSVKHNWNGRSFKTYEVFSKPVPYFCTELLNERNLYHLDLQFAADSKIAAYRIRGLGITKPTWVDAKWVGLR
jgi:hypothetical protein